MRKNTKNVLILVVVVVALLWVYAQLPTYGSTSASIQSSMVVVDQYGNPLTAPVVVPSRSSFPLDIAVNPPSGTPITITEDYITIGRHLQLKQSVTVSKNDPNNQLYIGMFKWRWDSATLDGSSITNYFMRSQIDTPDPAYTLIGTETQFSLFGTAWGQPQLLDSEGLVAYLNLKAFSSLPRDGSSHTVVVTFTISLVKALAYSGSDITSQVQPFSTTQTITFTVRRT